jgi:hypothetical protein
VTKINGDVPAGSVLDRHHRVGLHGRWAAWSYRDWVAVFKRDLIDREPTAHAISAKSAATVCGEPFGRGVVRIPATHARKFTAPCGDCEIAAGFATDGAAPPAREYHR